MPFDIIEITAAYSNAVLVAIMPHISDFSQKLDLPIPQPVTIAQVRRFNCSNLSDKIGGLVRLSNGYDFWFEKGVVDSFESPRSYWGLQDPKLIPTFFGKVVLTKEEAIQTARNAVKKLGYTDEMLCLDSPPKVAPLEHIGTNYIPRYRIEWFNKKNDFKIGNPGARTAQIEVDAENGQIDSLHLTSRSIWGPDPQLSVHPRVIQQGPRSELVGGTKINNPGQAYSLAFLKAILPQVSEFVQNAGLPVNTPITMNDVDMSHYTCGITHTEPFAEIYLKTGPCFHYNHGQVTVYNAPNAWYYVEAGKPPDFDKPAENYFGAINMTTNEAVTLVKKAIIQLGYSPKNLHMDKAPAITPPRKYGSNYFARCFLYWLVDPYSETTRSYVQAEVDMSDRSIKSLGINVEANTSLWRNPPDVGIPIPTFPDQPSQSAPAAEVQKPPVHLPPGMPLPSR